MVCRRNSNIFKLLGSVFVTVSLIYLWRIYQDPASNKERIVTVQTTNNDAFNKASEEELTEEDYDEEIVLWDEFNPLDVKTNKDIFFIESSG